MRVRLVAPEGFWVELRAGATVSAASCAVGVSDRPRVGATAVLGELVITLDGPVTANPGDWVIKGAVGEQWTTSAEHFAKTYKVTAPS